MPRNLGFKDQRTCFHYGKTVFEGRGYVLEKEQQVELEGVKLKNYVMEKSFLDRQDGENRVK